MLKSAYADRGSDAYHPATRLALLIYGYATGSFSSCKIERATYDSLAFRYIGCKRHLDRDLLRGRSNDISKDANLRIATGRSGRPAGIALLLANVSCLRYSRRSIRQFQHPTNVGSWPKLASASHRRSCRHVFHPEPTPANWKALALRSVQRRGVG